MLDNLKNLVLPDSVVIAIRDSVVDILADKLDGKKRDLVLKLHSDAKFRNELRTALERAFNRFAREYEDQALVDAIFRNTEFWTIKSVQEAIKEIIIRPSSDLEAEFKILRKTFSEVASTIAPERIDTAIHTFLSCISDEVTNIPQLAPIYQVQLQRISVQQGREMIAVLKDVSKIQQKALTAILETSIPPPNRVLIAGPDEKNDDSLQELKKRYFNSILQNYKLMDMGGISPRVTSKAESRVISVQMEDVFIPLKATTETPLQIEPEGHTVIGSENLKKTDLPIVGQDKILSTFNLNRNKLRQIEMEEILRNQKVVILGHPGAGKTTIGKYIAYMIAKSDLSLIGEQFCDYIPIIVKASEYGKSLKKNNILSFHNYITGKLYTDEYGPLFHWALKKKQCLVIIDGLDEVPDAVLRIQVAAKIEQFVSDYWENRFLVTSRIVGYRGNQLSVDFAHFILSDLEKEQIIEFLKNWYMAIEDQKSGSIAKICKKKAEDLWDAIEKSKGVKKLAGIPLLLTIIALVNYYGSELPDRRVDLYQLATETLLSNWPLKQRGQKIDWKEVSSVLEPIAYHIFTKSVDRQVTEYEFRPLFEQQVCKLWGTSARKTRTISNQLLDKIEQHTGFFLKRGTNEKGQDVYGFLHPTFAEYLTARYLAFRWVDKQALDFATSVHDASWHEVVLLLAGHLGTMADILATRFVDEIDNLASPYEDYLHRDLLLVGDIIGDNVSINRQKREEIVAKLILLALNTPYQLLWISIKKRLSNIARAFPFIKQPKELKLQENDSIALRVKKTILSTTIGIKKDMDIDILLQGLFLVELSFIQQEIFDLFIGKNYKKSSTYILVKTTPNSISWRSVPITIKDVINKLKPPFIDINTINQTIEEDGISSHYWLIDNQQYRILTKLPENMLKPVYKNAAFSYLRVLWGAFSYNDDFNAFQKEMILHLSNQAISSTKEHDLLNILNYLKEILNHTRHIEHNEKEHAISEIKTSMGFLLNSNMKPKISSKAFTILLSLTNKQNQMTILLEGLNHPEDEVKLEALERIPLTSQFSRSILDKLHELMNTASSHIRYFCAKWIIAADDFAEGDISILLDAICERSDEAIKEDQTLECVLKLGNKARKAEVIEVIINRFNKIIENESFDNTDLSELSLNMDTNTFLKSLENSINTSVESRDPLISQRSLIIYLSLISHLPLSSRIISLIKDGNTKVKIAAIESLNLNELDASVWNVIILDALKDNNDELKLEAIQKLSKNGFLSTDIANKIIEELREGQPKIAEAAITLLSQVKEPELRKWILDKAVQLVTMHPDNIYAYEVLWKLLVTEDSNRF